MIFVKPCFSKRLSETLFFDYLAFKCLLFVLETDQTLTSEINIDVLMFLRWMCFKNIYLSNARRDPYCDVIVVWQNKKVNLLLNLQFFQVLVLTSP